MQLFVPNPSVKKAAAQFRKKEKVKIEGEKPENFLITTWKTYAKNTSIHSVHFLTEPSFNIFARILWAVAIVIATCGMIYCCALLSNRFRTGKTSTVFESTSFKVSEIPFAAVTICNNNRQDFNKTSAAVGKFLLPNRTKVEKETFVKFLHILQNQEFGSFDEYGVLAKDDLTALEALNITEVYEFMMHDCEVFFVACWWRNKPFKCCDWFSKQRSEYGICWSFNSYTNVGSPHINRSSPSFPWRVQNKGHKSALKILLATHPETSIDRSRIINSNIGVMLILHHPYEWPSGSLFIGGGSMSSVAIKPTAFSTSEDVRGLSPEDRQCTYDSEQHVVNLMKLEGLPYMRSNCLAECRQTYLMRFCNCSVGFYYPAKNYPECNVSGLVCMIPHNDFVNALKPVVKNEFFDENEDGMECSCLPECSRISYSFELNPIYDEPKISEKQVFLDIHYAQSTMMKYRTDATFSGMDLLVGFGGVVSLFLGSSLLSGAEIFYFATVALFWHYRRSRTARDRIVQSIKARLPFMH